MIEWEKTEHGNCESIGQIPKGVKVISIDDKMVEEVCESCGKYLLEGDHYELDSEGCALCEKCIKEFLKS